MLYPYKKGNNEWTNTVPVEPEATPFTPLWSNGDGYQTNDLFIYRTSNAVTTTTAAYVSALVDYNIAVVDNTDWWDPDTLLWTPQVAGWWQIIAGAINSGGSTSENIVSITGPAATQQDTIGLMNGSLSAFGYFNGVTSSASIALATANSGVVNHQQNPQVSFFQALFLRP